MKKPQFLGCLGTMAGLIGVVAACGGGSSASGSGAGALDSFITQYCDSLSPCCAKVNKPYDQAKCRLLFTAFTTESTYDAAIGQQCLDAIRAEQNTPAFCDTGLSDEGDKKCDGVFKKNPSTGTKQPGQTCEDDSECASTAEGEGNCASSFTKDTTVRQCQIQTRGKEGEECLGEKESTSSTTTIITSSSSGDGPPPLRAALCWIDDGLFCESTFIPGTSGTPSKQVRKCAKTQPVDGPCQSSTEHACVKDAFCDSTAKKCLARRAAGAECTGFSSNQCLEKHFCDSTTKKCTPSVPAGGACAKNEECDGRSCTNGKCGSSSSINGTTAFVCVQ